MALRATVVCALSVLLLAGCGGGSKSSSGGDNVCSRFGTAPAERTTKAPWTAPENPMAPTWKAGLVPEQAEFLQYHVPDHLDVFVNGGPVLVPAGIGIDVDNPGVKSEKNSSGMVTGTG